MKEILEQLKLIDYLTLELPMQKAAFIGKLKEQVDDGDTSYFSDSFDPFTSTNNEYKGRISPQGFKLKRRRKFFDMNMSMPIASGTYTEKNDQLIVATKINGFHGLMLVLFVLLTLIYAILLVGIPISNFMNETEGIGFIAIPFILAHALFMYVIPYFMMKRSVQKLKQNLERDFLNLSK